MSLFGVLAEVYSGLSKTRNWVYDKGLAPTVQVTLPVVSFGNLTVGGTGKTPVADFTLKLLLEKGHRPGLVTRSYRADLKSPERVKFDEPGAAALYGDEAVWLAGRHPQVPIWSGPVKSETARALAGALQLEVLLVDDGFQHRRLRRNLDVLLVDATEPLGAYRCVPAGRGREPFSSWRRADVILLTKTNLAESEHVAALRKTFSVEKPVFEFESVLATAPVGREPVLLVSGIARPESFKNLFTRLHPEAEMHEMRFADHHPFNVADLRAIAERVRSCGARRIFITEKDDVKLRPLVSEAGGLLDFPVEVAPLRFELKGSADRYYEVFRGLLR